MSYLASKSRWAKFFKIFINTLILSSDDPKSRSIWGGSCHFQNQFSFMLRGLQPNRDHHCDQKALEKLPRGGSFSKKNFEKFASCPYSGVRVPKIINTICVRITFLFTPRGSLKTKLEKIFRRKNQRDNT